MKNIIEKMLFTLTFEWKFYLIPILTVLLLIGFIVYLFLENIDKPYTYDGVKCNVEGVTKIVEIETNGEKH